MAVEREWSYVRIGASGEGDGRSCIFCGQRIAHETQPGYWQNKAIEDKEDADFVVEDGYAHHTCSQQRLAGTRKRRFSLPDVPDLPKR